MPMGYFIHFSMMREENFHIYLLYDHMKTVQMDTTGSPATLIPINLLNNITTLPETLLSSYSMCEAEDSPVTQQQFCHGRSVS